MKKEVIAIPKDKKEAEQFLLQIGEEQRAIDNIELNLKVKASPLETKISQLETKMFAMQAEMSQLQDAEMVNIEPHQEKISQLVEGVSAYAKANRDELTEGFKLKTVELLTGILAWRKTPQSVSLDDKDEVIVKILKSLKLKCFIRIKETVDKEAMLREPEKAKKVDGVRITQSEKFIITPTGFAEIIGYVEELEA